MFRHLLVPTDGSELSDRAIRQAVSFARFASARITFLHVTSDGADSIYGDEEVLRAMDPEAYAERHAQRVREILDRACEVATSDGVACEARTRSAPEAWEAIVAGAGEYGCDLILMASHGHRGIKGLILGSQTQKVLVSSSFPVLVYR